MLPCPNIQYIMVPFIPEEHYSSTSREIVPAYGLFAVESQRYRCAAWVSMLVLLRTSARAKEKIASVAEKMGTS
jgi:hypothetical protein